MAIFRVARTEIGLPAATCGRLLVTDAQGNLAQPRPPGSACFRWKWSFLGRHRGGRRLRENTRRSIELRENGCLFRSKPDIWRSGPALREIRKSAFDPHWQTIR